MGSNDWTTMPFSQAVQVNPPVPLQRGAVYPFIDMQAVDPGSRSVGPSEMREFNGGGSRFIDGDTLMARITPCLENGKIARFTAVDNHKIGHGSTEFIVIRGKLKVTDNAFAYYLTKWDYVHLYCISQMTGSSGRQRVPTNTLSYCEVTIPPLKQQQAIAYILGALDDKIELNRRMNQTLEEMAQSTFKSWFVDFDPVRYKAAGQEPPGLARHIADLFPDSFEDSKLGEIPRGWQVLDLDEVMQFQNGYAFKSADLLEEDIGDCYRVFKMGHILKGGGLNKVGTKSYIERSKCKDLQKYVLAKGDLLICMTDMKSNVALLGHTALMDEDDRYIVNQRVGLIRVKDSKIVNYPYLYLLTNSTDFIEELRSRANSGVQVNLSTNEIKASRLIVPDSNIHNIFDSITIAIFEKIFCLQKESDSLANMRDALLPRLISGELRIPDAERIVERCM